VAASKLCTPYPYIIKVDVYVHAPVYIMCVSLALHSSGGGGGGFVIEMLA